MKTYKKSAKIIFLGEHAVVKGGTAIAAAIDKELTLNVLDNNDSEHKLSITDWDLDISSKDTGNDIIEALAAIEKALPGARKFSTFSGKANFPCGAGLGSSASLALALSQAIASDRYPKPTQDAIVSAAHKAEKVFHDTPSGLDVSAISTGGFIAYKTDRITKLPNISPLPVAVGISNETRSTKEQIHSLRQLQSKNQQKVDKVFEAIGNLSEKALDFLKTNNWETTGKLMTKCHKLLGSIGVSTKELDAMVETALGLGAYGSKLTGAGGGGSVIAVGPKDTLSKIVSAWESSGYNAFIAQAGV